MPRTPAPPLGIVLQPRPVLMTELVGVPFPKLRASTLPTRADNARIMERKDCRFILIGNGAARRA